MSANLHEQFNPLSEKRLLEIEKGAGPSVEECKQMVTEILLWRGERAGSSVPALTTRQIILRSIPHHM